MKRNKSMCFKRIIVFTHTVKSLNHSKEPLWSFKSETGYQQTYSGPLLAVSAGTIRVEDPNHFLKAAVELRSVRWKTERVSRRQLVQVVVGSEAGPHLTVERVPHVHGVVPAAAGQTGGDQRIVRQKYWLSETKGTVYLKIVRSSLKSASIKRNI